MNIDRFNNILKNVLIDTQNKVIKKQNNIIKNNEFVLDVEQKIGAFAIQIDDLDRANDLLDLAYKQGLSIEKMSNKKLSKYNTNILAFGFDDQYDVTFIQGEMKAKLLNIKPIYSSLYNYTTLYNKISKMASEKENLLYNKGDGKKTYRTLYLEKASIAQNVKNGLYSNNLTLDKQEKTSKKEVVVEEYDHFIQIGSVIIPKNPNDYVRKINVFI